jgi:hypothetical protein
VRENRPRGKKNTRLSPSTFLPESKSLLNPEHLTSLKMGIPPMTEIKTIQGGSIYEVQIEAFSGVWKQRIDSRY